MFWCRPCSDLGRHHDDRLREPSVMELTPFAGSGSQVIQLHGVTIPCSYFRRSDNTQIGAVLGRVGLQLGQSE